ncbi:MAG: class I SAM-dependent methyltransferase [Pseudomonadota bacterium]
MIAPVMLTAPEFSDYELIDCGFGEKLERYGQYLIVRPEGQALFQPSLETEAWQSADAVFAGVGEDDDKGRWRFQNKLKTAALEDAWPIRFRDVRFHARFTAFRHMGFFAEQAAHWDWISDQIRLAGRPIKVLNLFGYTGVASLVAAAAGASVTHVDASKKAIGWARENQTLSGLGDAPIRWICDDAAKFVAREARRDNAYDAIIMDPPKYGRGPKGEVWHYFDDLPEFMHLTRSILSRTPLFFLLSSYAIRASYLASHELARDVFAGLGGKIESGELLINQTKSDRSISTSLYTRWHNGKVQNG